MVISIPDYCKASSSYHPLGLFIWHNTLETVNYAELNAIRRLGLPLMVPFGIFRITGSGLINLNNSPGLQHHDKER